MTARIKKNSEVVKSQYRQWLLAMEDQTDKIKFALSGGEYRRAVHHAAGYLEETIDQMPRLWFYVWLPKWALIVYLIQR